MTDNTSWELLESGLMGPACSVITVRLLNHVLNITVNSDSHGSWMYWLPFTWPEPELMGDGLTADPVRHVRPV